MNGRAPAALALALAAPLAASAQTATYFDHQVAVLQGLDKVTARVSTFEAPIDRTVNFGTLRITARACRKRPPEETPESAAFLDIREEKLDETPRRLFGGWMFASSPALSPLEHPVYDVWLLDCKKPSKKEPSSAE